MQDVSGDDTYEMIVKRSEAKIETSSGVAILGKGTAATDVSKVAVEDVPKKFVTCNSAVYVAPGTRFV